MHSISMSPVITFFTFLRYLRQFLSDFENNVRPTVENVEISIFFCIRWAIKTNFFEIENILGFGGLSHWGSVIFMGRLPPKGTSKTSPLIIHAFFACKSDTFYVGYSRKNKIPRPKPPKIPLFRSLSSYA